jgi:single-stranded DNA-binding protein
MTEASVSFAGNLTDDPEVRYTEGGIARLGVRSKCTWHAASRATPSPSPSPSGSVVSTVAIANCPSDDTQPPA